MHSILCTCLYPVFDVCFVAVDVMSAALERCRAVVGCLTVLPGNVGPC